MLSGREVQGRVPDERFYLDPMVREGISTFSKIGDVDSQLGRLESDIDSGAWEQRYSGLKDLEVLDLGYRILIAHRRANHCGA